VVLLSSNTISSRKRKRKKRETDHVDLEGVLPLLRVEGEDVLVLELLTGAVDRRKRSDSFQPPEERRRNALVKQCIQPPKLLHRPLNRLDAVRLRLQVQRKKEDLPQPGGLLSDNPLDVLRVLLLLRQVGESDVGAFESGEDCGRAADTGVTACNVETGSAREERKENGKRRTNR
jgi:hypothetical protein